MNKTYLEEYKRKLITPEQAAALVQTGDIIEYGQFATKPVDFDRALAKRAGEPGLMVPIRMTGGILPVPEVVKADPEQRTFMMYSWFCTALDRKMSDYGLLSYIPKHYHEATETSRNPRPQIHGNFWVCQTTPMDEHGCFNFGLAASHSRAVALNARVAIVEVNHNMPYCPGGNNEYVHISEIDYIIEGSNTPIFTTPPAGEPTPEERRIAELIMEEIPDGACMQLGIGAMPNLLGHMIAESDLKDLGVQSEMFCDAFVEMYEKGKITNRRKAYDQDKSTYAFCLGTQETYDFLNRNPRCGACTVEYTNHPARIAMHDNVISINNILEADLFGQICSESSGTRQISGTGGQLDFVDGAYHSKGGKSFLAFVSTYKDKEGNVHSRIKPMLTPGAIVTVPRASVHYLVTENGKVNMKDLSIWGRAEAMISLAHPDFRDELIKAAQDMKIWTRTNKTRF